MVCCQSIKGMTAVVVTHPGRGNSVKPIRVLTLIDFNGMSLLKGISGKDTRRSKHNGSAFGIWSCFSSAAWREIWTLFKVSHIQPRRAFTRKGPILTSAQMQLLILQIGCTLHRATGKYWQVQMCDVYRWFFPTKIFSLFLYWELSVTLKVGIVLTGFLLDFLFYIRKSWHFNRCADFLDNVNVS